MIQVYLLYLKVVVGGGGVVIIFARFGGRSELVCLFWEGVLCNISPCETHFSAHPPDNYCTVPYTDLSIEL